MELIKPTEERISYLQGLANKKAVTEVQQNKAKSRIKLVVFGGYMQEDWYKLLIDDCTSIITESVFNSRWELIRGYHQLGERILQENHNFERSKIYGKEIVSHVSQSLGKSSRTIARAIQFVRMYPDINALPDGKNISWHKICNKLLSKTIKRSGCEHEEAKTFTICVECGQKRQIS